MAPPRKKAKKTEEPSVPKRSRTHRTETNPWEAAREEVYEVEKVLNFRIRSTKREYHIKWAGTDARGRPWEDTWEPMENLVGCAAQIREYEKDREAQDQADKEAVLKKKAEAKQAKEDEQKKLREASLAAAVDDTAGLLCRS